MTASLQQLLRTLPQSGRIEWIGLRPRHRAAMLLVDAVEAEVDRGLVGDRARSGVRAVTLIQAEHIVALSSLLHGAPIDAALFRRNLVISGINLLALKDRQFHVGGALFEYTGQAHPCSRMEEALGPGGLNAMRGHGGITARVVSGGTLRLGDAVQLANQPWPAGLASAPTLL